MMITMITTAIKFVIYFYVGSTVMAIKKSDTNQGDNKINTKVGKKKNKLQLISLIKSK